MNITSVLHQPVMLQEVLEGLAIKADGIYIDGTFGRGGHSLEILKKLGENGKLIAFDKDPEAVNYAKKNIEDSRFQIIADSFQYIKKIAEQQKIAGKVDGVFLDLGVSSPQLDEPERGFSFLRDGPLDMRMDTTKGMTAAEWIATAKENEIADVLFQYGEERFGRRIANAIVRERTKEPIVNTLRLAEIASAANPAWEKTKHPATRTFQAIRIFINEELTELQKTLDASLAVLGMNGRLVVLSFHSLEDRIVKRFIRRHSRGEEWPMDIPVMPHEIKPKLKSLGRAVKATNTEVAENSRSRSAILRIAEVINL